MSKEEEIKVEVVNNYIEVDVDWCGISIYLYSDGAINIEDPGQDFLVQKKNIKPLIAMLQKVQGILEDR